MTNQYYYCLKPLFFPHFLNICTMCSELISSKVLRNTPVLRNQGSNIRALWPHECFCVFILKLLHDQCRTPACQCFCLAFFFLCVWAAVSTAWGLMPGACNWNMVPHSATQWPPLISFWQSSLASIGSYGSVRQLKQQRSQRTVRPAPTDRPPRVLLAFNMSYTS